MHKQIQISTLTMACLIGLPSFSDVTLPSLFSDHMVLQREMPIVIWGWADPGEGVQVRFGEKKAVTEAGNDGRWQVQLKPMPAEKTGRDLVVEGKNKVVCKDVLLGEVWLCGGQSNMEWNFARLKKLDERDDDGNQPLIRHFRAKKVSTLILQKDLPGQWTIADGEVAGGLGPMSAIGFYFGRALQRQLDGVPVGLLGVNWGGSKVEAWTSEKALEACSEAAEHYQWVRESRANDNKPIRPKNANHAPSMLHTGMIAPITPIRFRGVIWYQGESNARTAVMAGIYKAQMHALLADWRRDFGQPDLPFAQVMLAGFNAKGFSGWCEVRQAQLETFMEDSHGGLATAHDIGSPNNIHPTNKLDVGRRLADWALCQVYGQKDAVAHGPLAETFVVKDAEAQVTFKSPGGKLNSSDGEPLRGFELAGKNGIFHPAIAQIRKEGTVHLKSDPVSSPVSVRYGWTAMPDVNLVDTKGFPAFPFKREKINGTL